jgi:tRNA(adenine34) deaminase
MSDRSPGFARQTVVSRTDESFMAQALQLAGIAYRSGEVPVGALVVVDGHTIGEGYNRPITDHDPTAHAEVVALRAACARVGNYRLSEATLYVTVEPCTMCAGALVHARIKRIVFAAREPKAGAVVSHPVVQGTWLNHRIEVVEGVLAHESGELLSRFFAERRQQQKQSDTEGAFSID